MTQNPPSSSYASVISRVWQSVQEYFIVKPEPLWVRAIQERGYQNYQKFKSDLKYCPNVALKNIISPYAIMAHKNIAPQIKNETKQLLNSNSQQAQRFFYNDLINHLVDLSASENRFGIDASATTLSMQIFKEMLEFYQPYIEMELYETILNGSKNLTEKNFQNQIQPFINFITPVFKRFQHNISDEKNKSIKDDDMLTTKYQYLDKTVTTWNLKSLILTLASISLLNSRTNVGFGLSLLWGGLPGVNAELNLDNLENTAEVGVVLQGRASNDKAGYSVRALGDVNGDGITDMAVGAPYASPLGRTEAGEVYIIFGRSGNWSTPFDLNNLDVSTGVILQGRAAGDNAGFSVSGLEDVNGDGIADILVGAPEASPPSRSGAGEAYIIFGRNGDWFSLTLDLNTLDGTNGVILQGANIGDATGHSVSGLGDVNGDGMSDMLIGANDATYHCSFVSDYCGQVYIIFGRNGGWSSTLDLNSISFTMGVVIVGQYYEDHLGDAVSKLGDINGDGISDILLGVPQGGGSNDGEVYIIFGRSGSWYPAILELGTLISNSDVVVLSGGDSTLPGYSVSELGDVNGDGITDMLIGSPGESGATGAYIIFGKNGTWPSTVDLNTLDMSTGVTLRGSYTYTGYSVSALGDVDGDGVSDMLIGAPSNVDVGKIFVIFGTDQGWSSNLIIPTNDVSTCITLQGLGNVGSSVTALGDVNGDGISDMLLGVPDASPLGRTSAGQAYIIFGQDFAAYADVVESSSDAGLYIGLGVGLGTLAVASAIVGFFAIKRKCKAENHDKRPIEMLSQEEIHLPVRATIQSGI